MDRTFRDKVRRLLAEARSIERRNRERIELSKNRLAASGSFEKPDRVPVTVGLGPIWSNWYFRKYGIRVGEYWRDPKLNVLLQLRIWIDSFKDFDDDRTYVIPNQVGPLGGVVLHPSIAGCRAILPEDDFAWIDLSYRYLDSKEKIDQYEVPDVARSGLMPETLLRLEEIEGLVGDLIDVRIQGGDGAPLQMAAYTRGVRELIRDMYTDPPIVDKLMGKMIGVYDAIFRYYRDRWGYEYRGGDVEGLFYDNPLSYFSPQLVGRFVLPHYRAYAERCGWRHWSFETQDVMDGFIDLLKGVPVKAIHNLVSNSDLRGFREAFLSRGVRFHVFMAPGTILTRAIIGRELKRVMGIMGREGGWTLSSGVLDSATSADSIQHFLKIARELG